MERNGEEYTPCTHWPPDAYPVGMRYILNTPGQAIPPTPYPQQAPDIDRCCGKDLLTYENVARRAYFNYLANGSSEGNAVQDWLDAESRLRLDSWSVPATREATPNHPQGSEWLR